jgi:hypothetical protein
MEKDSLIFSCDWDNYQKNVLIDKEDRTVGAWAISPENMQKLKYAYAYLTNSDKTVVKKFHIEKFETAKIEKGYTSKIGNFVLYFQNLKMFFLNIIRILSKLQDTKVVRNWMLYLDLMMRIKK